MNSFTKLFINVRYIILLTGNLQFNKGIKWLFLVCTKFKFYFSSIVGADS